MKKRKLSHYDCYQAADVLSFNITQNNANRTSIRLYGVPRGGIPAAYLLQGALYRRALPAGLVSDPKDADIIVDDIVDSGATRKRYQKINPRARFVSLFENPSQWLIFPWEESDIGSGDDIATRILQYVGEDTNRGGLVETPARVAKAWQHWTKGYEEDPSEILKVFEDGGEDYDQMVLVKKIPVYSHCEHHLAPIFGVAHVAYIPNGKICGLSKLSRLVDCFGRRLQVQERLTSQVAEALDEHLQPKGVAVQLDCRHMCMESRGICQQGHSTVTTALKGVFLDDVASKQEFLQQCSV